MSPAPHQIRVREVLRTHTLEEKKVWCFLPVGLAQEWYVHITGVRNTQHMTTLGDTL